MPRIQLTPDDMSKGIPIAAGWYKAEVMDAIAKPSKDKQSINYVATVRLENYQDGQQTIDARFNSKAMGFIKPFLAALKQQTLAEFILENKAGIDFDFESVKGGKLQVKVDNKMFEDRQVSEVKDYAPYNYSVPF